MRWVILALAVTSPLLQAQNIQAYRAEIDRACTGDSSCVAAEFRALTRTIALVKSYRRGTPEERKYLACSRRHRTRSGDRIWTGIHRCLEPPRAQIARATECALEWSKHTYVSAGLVKIHGQVRARSARIIHVEAWGRGGMIGTGLDIPNPAGTFEVLISVDRPIQISSLKPKFYCE